MFLTLFSAMERQNITPGRISVPVWLFWLMIILIVLLALILFIRDKGLRKGMASLLSRTKKRFERSRIQSRIKHQEKDMVEAISALGEKSWRLKILTTETEEIHKELASVDEEIQSRTEEQDKIESEKSKLKEAHEKFLNEQNKKIRDQELKKKPHADKLSLLRNDIEHIEKDLQKKRKDIQKLEEKINSTNKDLENIKSNDKINSTEKKVKIDVFEGDLKTATQDSEALRGKIPSLEEVLDKYRPQLQEEEKKVNEFDHILKNLNEEKKEAQQKFDKEMDVQKKQMDKINKGLDELERRRSPMLEKLGKAVNAQRPDHAELAVFYSRIDSLNSSIQSLRERLQRLSK